MSLINKIKKRFFSNEVQKKLLEGAAKGVLIKIIGLSFAYLFAFVVARLFGAEVWGQFSLALSVILLASILGSVGLDTAILKLVSSNIDKQLISGLYKQVLIITLIISLAVTYLFYISSNWLASFVFSNPELHSLFQLASFAVVPFVLIKLNASVLQGLGKTDKYFFIKFASQHILGLIFLFILFLFFKINNIVLTAYITGLYFFVIVTFYWVFSEYELNLLNSDISSSVSYSTIFTLSIPLLFAGSMIFLNKWVDTIMVGIIMDEQNVGVYNIAVKLSGLLAIVLTAINAISAPEFSKNYASGDSGKFEEFIQASTNLIFVFTVPFFLILIFFSEFILGIFGDEFRVGWLALSILCIGNLVNALAGSVGYILQMTGSQNAFMAITTGATIAGIILNLFLIPLYGIEGAASATCITMIIWNVSCVIYIRYKYKIRTYFNPF